jgi:glycerol-3-phosphate dehydrogenase (NAD+)
MKRKVCILGGGSYGTVIARVLGQSLADASSRESLFESNVCWWVRRQTLADEINTKHTNQQYTGDSHIPKNVVADSSLANVVRDADVLVIAVPHQFLDGMYDTIKSGLDTTSNPLVVSLIKSFAVDTQSKEISPISSSIAKTLGANCAVLMGPNIYTEMAKDEFAEATIGVKGEEHAALLKQLFTTEAFKVEVTDDVIAVDLCGSLKNCITLGCGYTKGLDLGYNTSTALIRAGHIEIGRFCTTFFPSCRVETFSEACGIGDLMLSCLVGRGQRLAEAFVRERLRVEGSDATGEAKGWAVLEDELLNGMKIPDWHNIQDVHAFLSMKGATGDFPLIDTIYRIGFEGAPPQSVVSALRA